ncbi:MAG: metallophosphoesterase [Clostridiales bacterium]|nr:metallophosphoesterase [Clostridiales bacterium]
MVLTYLVKAVRLFLVTVMTVASVIIPGKTQGKIEPAQDGCRASFAAMSDVHMKNNFIRQGMFELGLADIKDAKTPLDAVVFDGDNTDRGYDKDWDTFATALKKYGITDKAVIAIGNHDTRSHEYVDENGRKVDDVEAIKSTFAHYNKVIANRDINETYYSEIVGGCYMIVLGSEDGGTAATVSQRQIEWFEEQMNLASLTRLPIFVFFHQPINGTHGLPYTWEMKDDVPERGGIGEASDQILSIIKKHKNVFYVSGHIHTGLIAEDAGKGYATVERYDGYTLINLPCYMYPDVIRGGHFANGTGLVFEVYDNEVLIRGRNFATGTWLTKYDASIPLK